ncbi:hypothetical protein [Methylobacterium symbioticum]|jgi:hypothetical protein|uniref:Uncharacterized protein n=1 Tax=Methylobacterium symbioticum TaxID=2584084 RepID=A0A509EAI8_9HYPH|nr:hypothetical protein [Methylobacterium symbioticum]VUD71148.1 hypothetical protein MET9862_01724 [Methylobacterium symbioticum]
MVRIVATTLAILFATAGLAADGRHHPARRPAHGAGTLDPASEARITQAPDRSTAPARPISESEAKNAPVRGSSAPVTCNDQNASSPTCYTATQQARPITR